MKVVLGIILVAVVFIAGAFAFMNSGLMNRPGEDQPPATTVYFFGKYEGVAVSLLGLICFGVGVGSVVLFAFAEEIRLRSRIRKLQKDILAMRKEVNALRNLPLAAEILAKDTEHEEVGK